MSGFPTSPPSAAESDPSSPPPSAVIILAGGSGSRVGAQVDGQPVNKVYLPVNGRAVLLWSVHAAARARGVVRLVLVVREQDADAARDLIASDPPAHPVEVVTGGASRHASEAAGIATLRGDIESGRLAVVAVHDAARPLASTALFEEVLSAAAEHGGALPAIDAGTVVPLVEDSHLVRVQTPQAFVAKPLLTAFDAAAVERFEGTDTSSCVERFTDLSVQVIPGSMANLKVTYADDVAVASNLLANTASA